MGERIKYFAKYLAVDGETKEGDKWNSINGEIPGSQHVRLFLCSRDIQAEDIYYTNDLQKYKAPSEIDEEYLKYNYRRFKVVGEISPKAVWVKEGDEFDEEDVQPSIELGDILDVEIKCPTCKTFH